MVNYKNKQIEEQKTMKLFHFKIFKAPKGKHLEVPVREITKILNSNSS